PEHLALARNDFAVIIDTALDAECAGMFRDLVEHFLKGESDLHRSPRDHGERESERFELDVELGSIARAEEWHLDAHLVFWPAEQASDLSADKRGTLRRGV